MEGTPNPPNVQGLAGVFQTLEDRERYLTLGEGLHIRPDLVGPGPGAAGLGMATRTAAASAGWLDGGGWTTLPTAADAGDADRLAAAIGRLAEAGLPAVCVYVYDEIWSIGVGIQQAVCAATGRRYGLADDAWAWRIEPGGGRGWPPHRGITDVVLDRAAPEVVNVWVALVDVAADQACMHFVPLDEDPNYPRELSRIDAPLDAVHASPIPKGTALVWNANVLHWGGPCGPSAAGPRVSASFTLVRADAAERVGERVLDLDALAFLPRVDLVARQIVTYENRLTDVAPEILSWARATCALGAQMSAHSRRKER